MENIEFNHVSVLLNESIENLNIKPDGIYVDGTMGGAGHSLEIAKKLSKKGMLIGIDRDEEALEVAKERLKEFSNVKYVHDNHDNIYKIIKDLELNGVDGILLDLGVSSYQIDEKTRGFTYMDDGPLDMRMDKSQELTAEYIVNNYKEKELARIIFEYGEEKFSKKIARNICEWKKNKKIETTAELVKIIERSIPGKFREKNSHPAKRTFQAIRIEVNNELEVLKIALRSSLDLLKVGGRIAVITFHSLEDRIVKELFNEYSKVDSNLSKLPFIPEEYMPKYKIIANITPCKAELEENPRARSSRLRVIEKIKDW